MKIMDSALFSLFDDNTDYNETKEIENEIKEKIKSLKVERAAHNQRITEIDDEIIKLIIEFAEQRISHFKAEKENLAE